MSEIKRYHNIDLMECLGIIFVLIYHSTLIQFDFISDPSLRKYLYYFSTTILSTCVPIFFFANGYLLFNKKLDLKKHILKTIRLIIITGIWGIITLVILMFVKDEFLSVGQFASYLWSWENGWLNHMWFMGSLVVIYFFFPLLKSLFDKDKKIFMYFFITAFIFTFGNKMIIMLMDLISPDFADNYFNMFNPFRGIQGFTLVYFMAGGLMINYESKIKGFIESKKININILSVVLIVLSCVFLFVYGVIVSYSRQSIWDCVWNGYDTIFTLINVVCLYFLSKKYEGNIGIIALISKNTLGIYFIHRILINMSRTFLRGFEWSNSIVVNILYACLLGAISLLITLLIKKIPILKKLLI